MQTLIIAEAGKNFLDENESLYRARELALVAKNCGADAVKYQCHVSDELPKRDKSRHEWILLNEKLTPDTFWKSLKEYCDTIGMEFMVTPMSLSAAQKMNPLVKRWKVASPDINDWPMLGFLKSTEKEIIISTGMSYPDEVGVTKKLLPDAKYLHCISEYPVPIERLNLNMVLYRDGLSDHTMSLIAGAMAVALNASIIEKHFTINNWGKDAHMSLSPEQLKIYIDNIREAEKAIIKTDLPTEKEIELRRTFRP